MTSVPAAREGDGDRGVGAGPGAADVRSCASNALGDATRVTAVSRQVPPASNRQVVVQVWRSPGTCTVDDGLPGADQSGRGAGSRCLADTRAEVAAGADRFGPVGSVQAISADAARASARSQASAASSAASEVAARLTPSLSSHAKPPFRRVRVPQRCTRHSLAASQAGQWKRPWASGAERGVERHPSETYQRRERQECRARRRRAAPVPATSAAPAARAQRPGDGHAAARARRHRSARAQERAAGVGLRAPRVVAQVSAAAAARLPGHQPEGERRARAGRAARRARPAPPLAEHLGRSRRSPLGSRARSAGARRETTLLETKKAASTAAPAHPVPTSTSVPTTAAATAPSAVRLPARQARQRPRPPPRGP